MPRLKRKPIRDRVHPEVSAALATGLEQRRAILPVARGRIDKIDPAVHTALVAVLKVWVGIHLMGDGNKSWARYRSGLVEGVEKRCKQLGVSEIEISTAYVPVFEKMVSCFELLLNRQDDDKSFLNRCLPPGFRRSYSSHQRQLTNVAQRRNLAEWRSEYDKLLKLLKARLEIVKTVVVSKGPDDPIYVPPREAENRERERSRCLASGISAEGADVFYVPSYQAIMDGSSNYQRVARRQPEVFEEARITSVVDEGAFFEEL